MGTFLPFSDISALWKHLCTVRTFCITETILPGGGISVLWDISPMLEHFLLVGAIKTIALAIN